MKETNEHNYRKPRILNRICAHPEMIACALGACVGGILLYLCLSEVPLRTIAPNWQWMLYILALAVPAATLLGCLLGMITCWPLVRVVCSRINGVPHKPGDQVILLTGPHKGTIAEVYEIAVGQGGLELAVIHLGEHTQVFDQWCLFRIKRSEQARAVSWVRPPENTEIKPHILNRICAHPMAVAWVICACTSSATLICWLLGEVHLRTIAPDWLAISGLLTVVFGGALMGSPMVKAVSTRINGAPLKPGDQVLILSGPYRGIIAEVSEITYDAMGWSSWPRAVIDSEGRQSFDQWSLLKLKKNKMV